MSSKVLIFSDLHYKLQNREVALSCLQQVQKLAHKYKIESIFFLGDFFNDKSIIRSEVLRESYEFFESCNDLNWVLFVGNHDYETTHGESRRHSLEVFKRLENVHVADITTCYPLFGKTNLYIAPYYHDTELFLKDLEKIPDDSILFCHQGVEGFHFSSGVCQKSQLKMDHFKRFKKVFIGHIHTPQKKNNVEYIGSPFTHTFGESGEEKRVVIYDFETNKVESIKLNLPKHVSCEINLNTEDDLTNIQINAKKNDYIKLIVTGPKEVLSKINKQSFPQFENFSLQKRETGTKKDILIQENSTYSSMIKTYLKTLKLDVDSEEIQKLCEDILTQVSQNAHL